MRFYRDHCRLVALPSPTLPLLVAPLALLLAGCAGAGTATTPRLTPESPRAGADSSAAGAAKTGAGAAAEAAADKGVAAATAGFGTGLLRRIADAAAPGTNVFVSPASVAFALSMAYNGAGGETRDAIARTLAVNGLNPDEVNRESEALLRILQRPDPHARLTIANALWANRGTTFRPDFVQRAETFFQAETATLDFADPAALDTINGWVSRKTNEKIPTLLNAGDLNGATSVLANAIYFKGEWTRPFDKAQTRDGVFRLANGKTKTLPMMAQTGTFATRKGDGFEAVRLPYGKSGDLAMFVFLPDETSDLAKLLDGLDGARWEEWMTGFRDGEVEVVLPRFKVAGDATLNEPLAALGMGVAFGAGADFGPMGLPGHFLSVVKHKAVMEVNEEGTEAAAATGVVSTVSLKPRFEVNRPFLCAIRDDRTGALLFLGAIADPQ